MNVHKCETDFCVNTKDNFAPVVFFVIVIAQREDMTSWKTIL